jgi:hypothetical protein
MPVVVETVDVIQRRTQRMVATEAEEDLARVRLALRDLTLNARHQEL